MKMYLKNIALTGILTLCAGIAVGQSYQPSNERSLFTDRKKSIMDGNLLRATYQNFGHGGRTAGANTDELIFEYPRNTDRTYIYFVSVIMGAEVPNAGSGAQAEFPISVVALGKPSATQQSFEWNPIEGYQRRDSQEMARSDRGPDSPQGNTWPDVWPDKLADGGDGWSGSWNGFFGRDQFNADVEFYYKAGDDRNRFFLTEDTGGRQYFPDPNDPNRGGTGFVMDARILAWSQTLVNATHFNIFEVKNDAAFNYRRAAFALWIADFVGLNASNDQPEFDLLRSIAYITDLDRDISEPIFDGPIGEMGVKFLETPSNSLDGIDNDGDSDFFDPQNVVFYNPDNPDLYSRLTSAQGGFYTRQELVDNVIPRFTADNFNPRTISPGDKIVLIQADNSRVVAEYPVGGGPVISQGITYNLPPGGITRREAFTVQADADYGAHFDGIDNDFDGLIDENQPNHLNKTTFNSAGQAINSAVRYINYLHFDVGDTIQVGLIVPNRLIRQKMQDEPAFAQEITEYQDALRAVHGDRLTNVFVNNFFRNFKTSAPMIDEARDDFFDNDGDWNVAFDDIGLEGDPDRPSAGTGDGIPSSGANRSFPGEPNIDKTDVSESDMIGVSKVLILGAGTMPTARGLDGTMWREYLLPGAFEVKGAATDNDILVSSSTFPIRSGQIERFAVAITAAQTKGSRRDDRDAINDNLEQATKAYEADYQFATAPTPPNVRAVVEDGVITLYWDDEAEFSFDRYIARITGNGFDFEGYKIYRSTDDAFEDARSITDALGNLMLNRPLAIYDKANGITGLHPVPIRGVQFNLGNDTGIRRFYRDSTIVNGKRYFYAVTSYDYGLEIAGIAPSESPIQISRAPSGAISLGRNVVEVRAAKQQAGYVKPEQPILNLVSGTPGGSVTLEIKDPGALIKGNKYSITFEDTLVNYGPGVDSLKTKNFTLRNISTSTPDTIIGRSTLINGEDIPVVDGFRIEVRNYDRLEINEALSGWRSGGTARNPHRYEFQTRRPKLGDYEIVIGNSVGFGRSIARNNVQVGPGVVFNFQEMNTNFKIFNTFDGNEVEYLFADLHQDSSAWTLANRPWLEARRGQLSAASYLVGQAPPGFALGLRSDVVIINETYRGTPNTLTYQIQMLPLTGTGAQATGPQVTRQPAPGDTLRIRFTKPFSTRDEYQFEFNDQNVPRIDNAKAKDDLKKILVVPNPYIVANPFEAPRTAVNPNQQRELHFTNMPVPATLRIFTISGELVREVKIQEGDTRVVNGTYRWDMLTKDNLELAYGVYLFHVKAPGVGEKTGKFAVIK